MSVQAVNEAKYRELIGSGATVLLDFYADWCGPCRMLSPVLEELEGEYAEVKFCKINVDSEPSLAAIFRVESIPLVAFVKDNTYLDMSLGYVPKEKLASMIEQYK